MSKKERLTLMLGDFFGATSEALVGLVTLNLDVFSLGREGSKFKSNQPWSRQSSS